MRKIPLKYILQNNVNMMERQAKVFSTYINLYNMRQKSFQHIISFQQQND